jgi:hypothetical protein
MQTTLIGSHAVFGKDIQNRGHCGVREAGFEKPIQKPTRGLLDTGFAKNWKNWPNSIFKNIKPKTGLNWLAGRFSGFTGQFHRFIIWFSVFEPRKGKNGKIII